MTAVGRRLAAMSSTPPPAAPSFGPYPRRKPWGRGDSTASGRHTRIKWYTQAAGTGLSRVQVVDGKLLGLGNACPFNEIGCMTNCTDTYYGEALAVVQAEEGRSLVLTVTDGKRTGTVTVPIDAKKDGK